MRAKGIAFFEVASTVSTTSLRSLQYLLASTYRSALTEVPLTNTPPALVFEIMYVSGPVGMTPLEAHAASNRHAETVKIFMVPPRELRRPILWTLPSFPKPDILERPDLADSERPMPNHGDSRSFSGACLGLRHHDATSNLRDDFELLANVGHGLFEQSVHDVVEPLFMS